MHCVKSVQIWSFFWSVFSLIWTECRKIRTRKKSIFGHFSQISDSLIIHNLTTKYKIQNTRQFQDYKYKTNISGSIQYLVWYFHESMQRWWIIVTYTTWSCPKKFFQARKMLFLPFFNILKWLLCWFLAS